MEREKVRRNDENWRDIDPDALLTRSQWREAVETIDTVKASVVNQLQKAQVDAKHGLDVDGYWVADAQRVLSHINSLRGRIYSRLPDIKRQEAEKDLKERSAQQSNEYKLFIEAAKIVLDRETYLSIWQQATIMK